MEDLCFDLKEYTDGLLLAGNPKKKPTMRRLEVILGAFGVSSTTPIGSSRAFVWSLMLAIVNRRWAQFRSPVDAAAYLQATVRRAELKIPMLDVAEYRIFVDALDAASRPASTAAAAAAAAAPNGGSSSSSSSSSSALPTADAEAAAIEVEDGGGDHTHNKDNDKDKDKDKDHVEASRAIVEAMVQRHKLAICLADAQKARDAVASDLSAALACAIHDRLELDATTAGNAVLIEKVEAANGAFDDMAKELHGLTVRTKELLRKVKAAEGEDAALRARLDAATQEDAALRARLDAATQELPDLRARALAAEAAAEAARQAGKSAAELGGRVEAAQHEAADLRAEAVRVERERDELRAKIDDSRVAARHMEQEQRRLASETSHLLASTRGYWSSNLALQRKLGEQQCVNDHLGRELAAIQHAVAAKRGLADAAAGALAQTEARLEEARFTGSVQSVRVVVMQQLQQQQQQQQQPPRN